MKNIIASILMLLICCNANAEEKKGRNKKKPINIYYSAPLSTARDLAGNLELRESIYKFSKGKYNIILPQEEVTLSKKFNFAVQNSASRDEIKKTARDIDIQTIFEADGIIVNMDRKIPNVGVVAEFFINRCLDKPAILFKTDAYHDKLDSGNIDENSAKTKAGPWSIMLNYYPKTVVSLLDSPSIHTNCVKDAKDGSASEIQKCLMEKTTQQLITELEQIDFSQKVDEKTMIGCAKIFNFEYPYKNVS